MQNSCCKIVKEKYYPVLIEYKGYKDKLVKVDSSGQVENKNAQNEPNLKNINSYAVNGAVHYANAILHHTNFTDVIAIGMTGYKDEQGHIQHQIGVYYVSSKNLGAGQKVDEYTDFSFLAPKNFDAFIEQVEKLSLTQQELERLKERREQEISTSLVKLNNDIFQKEKGLNKNLLEQGNCIFIGGKTFVVSYQEKDFFSNDSHNLILSLKNNLWKNKQTQLYLATCIRKSLSHKYSWGSSVSNRKIQKDIVFLPTINDKVDYDCMANLISAIKKLAIKKLLFYIKKEESEHTIRS